MLGRTAARRCRSDMRRAELRRVDTACRRRCRCRLSSGDDTQSLARGHEAVPTSAAHAATYAMVELEEGERPAAWHVSLIIRPFID